MTQVNSTQAGSPQLATARASQPRKNVDVPDGLWLRCPTCTQIIYRKDMEQALHTCPSCDHHFRLSARTRIELTVDAGAFEEMDRDLVSCDPIGFTARKPYRQQLLDASKGGKSKDALISGCGFIKGRPVILAVMDFDFLAGSMGAVVGEKITRAIERATQERLPLVIISCSGGARMQESTISLMQMAKTASALSRLHQRGGLFISVLADPTTGGTTASFAMLGDLIFAEPKAMIGFAGPRTIANTIRTELPEGFQRAEFLLQKGFVDRIVPRSELRSQIARTIDYCSR